MKANLLKSLIPAVLVIAGLAAGTGLLAGYIDRPTQAPQAAVDAQCSNCPLLNIDACCKVTGVCANPQTCTTPCVGTAANATPCIGTAANAVPCAGMAASTTPCTGAEGCPMPCCPKTGESPAAGSTTAEPQTTGCPFLDSSSQAVSPCGAGGCTGEK